MSALIDGGLVTGLARICPAHGPTVGGATSKERFESLRGAVPIFFVVLIIVFCICGRGPLTEADSVGVFVAPLMALWRGMRWPQLRGALRESAKLTVMTFTMMRSVPLNVRHLGFADPPGAFFRLEHLASASRRC